VDGLTEVGHFAEDTSPWGVQDLMTGVLEWTSSPAADLADHVVVRGHSPAAPIHPIPSTTWLARHRGARSPFIGFRLLIEGAP
jgi:formylglycine-generating enzyme required for sulfatase activity